VYQDKVQDVYTTSSQNGAPVPTLEVGTNVYVRNRYMGQWSGGFEVAGVFEDGYRLRRVSDGYPFPDLFPFDDVRPERRQHALRGIDGSYLDRDL